MNTLRSDRAEIVGSTGASILVGGTTASNIDVSAKLSGALPIFLVVVVGLAFILLTFAFRTILVPLKSIIGFLLSMSAALGAQVAIFQWGWGKGLLGITPAQTISFLPVTQVPLLAEGHRAHVGLFVALLVALVAWLFLFRTYGGFQLAVGA